MKHDLKDMGPQWVGVDLDGTLSEFCDFISPTLIGEPVPIMITRVKAWLEKGITVKIFTARVSPCFLEAAGTTELSVKWAIRDWCLKHLNQVLPITCIKDHLMIEMWDDICLHQVERAYPPK